MKISKTLFKTLSRCTNAPALYSMYVDKRLHDVKEIFGVSIQTIDSFNDEVSFDEIDEVNEIFSLMFDEETGEDLTVVTSAQLEAFRDIFTEVERLASIHIEKTFGHSVTASTNTYEQKKFKFQEMGNEYYCYLDSYYEDKKELYIFEVKATTSNKFDDVALKFTSNKESYNLPLFKKNDHGVYTWCAEEYIGKTFGKKMITKELVKEKADSIVKRYSKTGKYIYDIAVERYITEHSFLSKNEELPFIHYYLVVLNSNYVFDGEMLDGIPNYKTIDGEELFHIYDMNYLTSILQDQIHNEKQMIEKAQEHLTIKQNLFSDSCEMKGTTSCKFFGICGNCLKQDGSILEFLDLKNAFKDPKITDKTKTPKSLNQYDVINQGIYNMIDAKTYIMKPKNKIQIECFEGNKIYLDKDLIKKALDKIQYPIYHLDFESYNSPLPRFRGEKPYMQSLFQYSLHIEKSSGVCDIEKDHLEFLAKDHLDRRRELALKLIHDIDLSNGGTVLVYNQSFEKTRIKELCKVFPDLEVPLMKIHDHIFDLLFVLKGNKDFYQSIGASLTLDNPGYSYYHKDLHGSFSIKKVLPLFTDLTYKTLEVKNGTEAILTYGMLPTLTKEEYNNKYLALKVYCRQDTWAMVKILEGLRKLIK